MLTQALNGLAALTATDGWTNMVRVAFLVGVLSFGARALMTNKWDAIPLLTGLIAYMVMFAPKTTVSVTDAYGGGTTLVANVPIGLAAPLAVTSQVGRYFARSFEQAFSVVYPGAGYLDSGYMEPLSVLLKMRDGSLGNSNSDNNSLGNIERTLTAYMVQCVFYDLELEDGGNNEVTVEKIKKSPSTLDAIKTTFLNISVTTHLPGVDPAGGTVRSCNDAYDNIKAVLEGSWLNTYYDAYLQSQLNVPVNATTGTAEDRVGVALGAIQISSAEARNYMTNSLLANIIRRGEASYAASKADVASAIIRVQALEQRNVQWSAEKSMFEKIARPVTAFIEVFMVAAGPVMAFAIAALGPAGLSTLSKFLMMHIWVCLWMPTMAICNMYLFTVIEKWVINVSTTSGANLLSYGGMDSLNTELQTWLSVGSMLAAATPSLTLMLIWGTSQVATTLASRMHGADRVDPTLAAPALASSSPLVQNQSGYQGNPELPSYSRTGFAQSSLSYNNSLIGQEVSARNAVESTSRTAQGSIQNMFTSGQSGVDSISFSDSGQVSATGSKSRSFQAVYNTALSAGLSSGLSQADSTRFAVSAAQNTSMGADGNLGFSVGKGVSPVSFGAAATAGMGLTTSIADSSGLGIDKTQSALKNFSQIAQSGSSMGAELRDAVSRSRENRDGWSFNKEAGQSSSRSWSVAQSAAETAATNYSMASQATRVVGRSISWSASQLAGDLRDSLGSQWTSHVGSAYSAAFGGNQTAQIQAVHDVSSSPSFKNATPGMDASERLATAQAIVMMENKAANNGSFQGSLFAPLAGLSGSAREAAAGPLPDSSQFSGVGAGAPSASSVSADASSNTAGVPSAAAVSSSLDGKAAASPAVSRAAKTSGASGFFKGGVKAANSFAARNESAAFAAAKENLNIVNEDSAKARTDDLGNASATKDARWDSVVFGSPLPLTGMQRAERMLKGAPARAPDAVAPPAKE